MKWERGMRFKRLVEMRKRWKKEKRRWERKRWEDGKESKEIRRWEGKKEMRRWKEYKEMGRWENWNERKEEGKEIKEDGKKS